MNKRKRYIFPAIIAVPILICLSCSTVSNIGTDNWRDYFEPGHTKEEIAKDFNLYRGKWWNYYVRGRWYAEGGYYAEAIQDFKKAILIRSKDQRSARSYGLHFWEYFAHRELGVIYYSQKNYAEAKKELEASLSTADSARAKYYLNKCNEEITKTTQADREPPHIRVTSHERGAVINTPVTKLKGVAADDSFVQTVSVQGKKLFIELAEKNLAFSENISLHPGENAILLEATDLMGKNIRQDFNLTLDICPPLLYLDDILTHTKDGKLIATIKGTAIDDYGVKSLFVNDTEIRFPVRKETDFRQDIILTDNRKITFKVTDIAGNETHGEQRIGTKASLWQNNMPDADKLVFYSGKEPVRIAAREMDGATVRTLLASQENTPSQQQENNNDSKTGKTVSPSSPGAAGDSIPPTVHTDVKSSVFYDTNLFLSGNAHDDSGIAKLLINQLPLGIHPGKHVFFNHLLTLNEGENIISIKAVDSQGNETQLSPIKITKKTFELLETDARYTVALLPLRILAGQSVSADSLYSMLLRAFDEDPKRFNFVERDKAKLEQILQEQKISNTDLVSPDTAIKIGKIRAAEGMLFGSVDEDAKGITITLRLVDTETTQVLANTDVYDEDKSMKNLEWLAHGLSLKMKQQFPMIEGNVIRVSANGFHINAGATSGVGIGMKLLLFREIQEDGLMLKEPLDTVARVTQVQPETAFAKIISSKGTEKIEKKDLVIAK